MIRLTEKGMTCPSFPDLKAASDEQLVSYLAAASQVLRLAAQRTILRRGASLLFAQRLEALARSEGPLAPRVAAIFTLEQLLGRDSIATLTSLAAVPAIREFALHALADRREDAARVPEQPFVDGLTDADPRVRIQAVIGLGKLGKCGSAAAIVARTADDDPLVAHVAVQALVALQAVSACLGALDPVTPRLARGAARALQAMHTGQAVDGLIAKLESSADAAIHPLVFKTLCRLDHREADYTGDWWTTRPDTSGPYYKPVAWAETAKIERALEGAAF